MATGKLLRDRNIDQVDVVFRATGVLFPRGFPPGVLIVLRSFVPYVFFTRRFSNLFKLYRESFGIQVDWPSPAGFCLPESTAL